MSLAIKAVTFLFQSAVLPGWEGRLWASAPHAPSRPTAQPQPWGWRLLSPRPQGRSHRPARAGTDLLTPGAFCVEVSALFANEGGTLLPEPPSPCFQARCRHDLLHCLVIIFSYPIMFFKVKNARTLLWLHLGILQHLEDGKKKKKNNRGNQEQQHQQLLVLPVSVSAPGLCSGGEGVPSTPRVSLAGARSPG